MKQEFEKYTKEDQVVWNALFARQVANLSNKVCPEYLHSLEEMKTGLNQNGVPHFDKLNNALQHKNGWSIEVVPGLIPPEDFFVLLADKKFCSSTWLRNMDQLDYLEEPDMFHDIFGHVPLLMNDAYANFMHKFGSIGKENIHNPETIIQLQRLYWFTIEFGLMNLSDENKIYGAGIVSSFGETNHALSSNVEVREFDLQEIVSRPFCTSEIQNVYFRIDSFTQLYDALSFFEKEVSI